MCELLLQNRWPISAVLADESVIRVEHRRLDLTTTQWEVLGDLVKILHPLEIGTTYLCSEATSSLSSILPVLFGILKHLEVYLLIVKLEVGGIWMTLILKISKYLQQLWILGTKP